MLKIPVFIFIVCFIAGTCLAQNLDHQKWKEDIQYYHQTLEARHIDLYHTISKEDFTKEINIIQAKLLELTDFQVIIELMRLTQKVGAGKGDGHTSVPLWGLELHRFPLTLFDFNGELRVVKTTDRYGHLLGKRLEAIDGVAVQEVYSKITELTPFTENNQSSMNRSCSYMLISEMLFGLNLIKEKEVATFQFSDDKGKMESLRLRALSSEANSDTKYKDIYPKHAEIAQPDSVLGKQLWFTALDNYKTIYIKFRRYPAEEEMNEFAKEAYNFIDKNKSENLILDLRDNYGGDFYVGLILSGWLNAADSINWKSNVYVLVDRVTYSAAMVNAVQYKQLLNARVVGEPTGANPNGYQDLGQFKLPNSGLLITYTKRHFRLQDEDTQGLQPDVLITPKWKNYKSGLDEVLEWVLNDIRD